MERLLYICLAAVFYGIAAQQLIELVFAFLAPGRWELFKKPISKTFAIVFGAAFTALLAPVAAPRALELGMAGLLSAAASETANALVKMLVYCKEIRKSKAAQEFSSTGVISFEAIGKK